MHPIIIWSVCVLFHLAIEQSRQVIISQRLPGCYWLPRRHVIIFTPAKIVQWINAPLILGQRGKQIELKKSVQFDLFPEMSGGNFNSGAPLYIHGYLEEEGK